MASRSCLFGREELHGLFGIGAGGELVGFELLLQRGDAALFQRDDLFAGADRAVAGERLLVLVVLEVGVALFERDGVEFLDVFEKLDVGLHGREGGQRLVGLLVLAVEQDELHRAARGGGGLDAAGDKFFERADGLGIVVGLLVGKTFEQNACSRKAGTFSIAAKPLRRCRSPWRKSSPAPGKTWPR